MSHNRQIFTTQAKFQNAQELKNEIRHRFRQFIELLLDQNSVFLVYYRMLLYEVIISMRFCYFINIRPRIKLGLCYIKDVQTWENTTSK